MARRAPTSALLDSLWAVPVYLPYVQPPLTDAAVAAAEKRLRAKLPKAYVAALKIQNGGYLRRTAHPSDHAPVDVIAGIGKRFPSIFDTDWSDYKEHMASSGITTPARIDDLIRFCGDGHYYYCFDYRKRGRRAEPRITYVDVETFKVDEVLAPDFLTFLRALRCDDTRDTIGVCSSARITEVARRLSEATRRKFEDMGDQDHGYRTFRAKLSKSPTWAWLTANRVRRGFVRKSDREYAKLQNRMGEQVDRYPEHADCSCFLETSDARDLGMLTRALKQLGIATRKITLQS
jgi:hypothetical protein